MHCPSCGFENPEGMNFCGKCATSLLPTCPQCGFENPAGFAFCGKCATPLARSKTEPSSPPPEPPALDAERRQLTVMFCDLADSTKLSGQLDPEDLRDVIRAYQSISTEVIERYDGYIAQHLGDGLMVYFGWPQAHEDDARRAVHAGLGILEAIDGLNELLQHEKDIRLALRIGIHTGLVVVGEIGSGASQEHLALGETPNIASRIEGVAELNTVAISDATYQLVQGYFDYEELGLHTLKGVDEPHQVYRVVRSSGAQSWLDVATTRGLTPLVGRESEVTLLLERWQQVKEGRGQVVLLSGEAGIGKSRLLRVLREHIADQPHTLQACRCSPYHTQSAFYPLIELLQRKLGWQTEDTNAEKRRKLKTVLGQTHLDSEIAVPLFSSLLSLPLPDGRYAPLTLSSQRQRQETLEAFLRIVLLATEQHPVLFIVEDLHWIDPSSLEFLDLLIGQAATAALLIVLTCRPEFQSPWGLHSYLTPIALNRLTRPQIEQMVERVSGEKSLPPEIIGQLMEKTDGVPLYVEEMTKAVLESGALQQTAAVRSLAIPATLQDSLMARLDRLGSAKAVVQYGAVIGRQFSYDLLCAVAPFEAPTLQRALGRLVESELLYQRGLPPAVTYTFKHALIQDVAYQSLLKSTRQHYHQAIAQALLERFPEITAIQPELLAYHYTEAGLNDQAVLYWSRAGERAHMRSANLEAISHLRKGLDTLATLPNTAERDRHELSLQTILGQTLKDTQGYGATEVARVYTRVRELCQLSPDSPELFRALLGQSIYCIARAELQSAYELGERLLEFARRDRDPVFLVEAYYALGVSAFWLGKFIPAREYLMQGIAHYDADKHQAHIALFGQDGGAVCLCRVAVVLWYLGFPDQALAMSQQALTLVRQLGHPFSMAYVQLWTVLFHHLRREPLKARELTEAVMALSIEQGFPYWSTQATIMQGWTYAQQGPITDGIAQIQQGLIDLHRTGTLQLDPYVFGILAELYWDTGQIQEGLGVLDNAIASVDRHEARYYEAELYRLKGELLLQAESTPEDCFYQSLAVARRQQAKSWELRTATSLARLWQSQDKRQAAHDLLAPVYSWFTEGFDTVDLKDARALLDELG